MIEFVLGLLCGINIVLILDRVGVVEEKRYFLSNKRKAKKEEPIYIDTETGKEMTEKEYLQRYQDVETLVGN